MCLVASIVSRCQPDTLHVAGVERANGHWPVCQCYLTQRSIGWSDVAVIRGHITISTLPVNSAYCVKISGGDLSRYSNKIESAGLRRCPYYHYLTKESDVTITNISQSLLGCSKSWREYGWHRYGMKKLRHCLTVTVCTSHLSLAIILTHTIRLR